MEDMVLYDFLLKINTYLNRMNIIASKFMAQEQKIAGSVVTARTSLPPEVFAAVFQPLLDELDNRIKLLDDMRESNDEFQKNLTELHNHFRGTIQ